MKDEQDLWLVIMAEIERRRQKGLLDYGRPVAADDTIDWLAHAEAEFLDGAVYCRAARGVVEQMRLRMTTLEDKVNTLIDQNWQLTKIIADQDKLKEVK